jgi:hypothetical protein
MTPDRTLFGRITTAVNDLRFGGIIRGISPSRFHDIGAHRVSHTPYHVLPIIFDGVIRPDDVLVDVGCGPGRVLNWWLSAYPKNTIYGIEIDPDIASHTRKRLRKYPNVEIICGDASDSLPESGTVFFMFNPFDEGMMRRFCERILELRHPVRIIYYFARHLEAFDDPRFFVRQITVPPGFHPTVLVETYNP